MFYAYTKSLHLWTKRLGQIPENFRLTASRGGKFDDKIEEFNLPEAVVVYHPEEAKARGLEIDHNDSHAYSSVRRSFALLLHGTQPTGSDAAEAMKRMKSEKIDPNYRKGKDWETEAESWGDYHNVLQAVEKS